MSPRSRIEIVKAYTDSFQRFATARFGLVEVEPADFRTVTVLIETPLALCAGDALHLAVARRLDATLASIDRRLGGAAGLLGIGRADLV